MTLRCTMGVALYLILYSCGIHALLPSVAAPQETYGFEEQNATLRTDEGEMRRIRLIHDATVIPNATWVCPSVTDVPGVSCSCDIPHTVRCRGHASTPRVLRDLTDELRSTTNQSDSKVSLLDLTIHGIDRLPSFSFEGLPLLGLVISAAGLKTTANDAFKGLEKNLTALGLADNNFKYVPAGSLKVLRKLQRLDLSDNAIETLKTHEFPTLLQLRNLNLKGNGLRIIEREAFSRLPQLKTLSLGHNLLDASQITERTLWGLHFLSTLSLQSNLLKGFLTSTFLGSFPKLITLDLSHNSITKIVFGALEGCKNLQTLDLSYNKIDIIEDHAFKHLSNLKHLEISHNHIISVSGWSLAYLPNLVSLSLADNALLAVTADLVHQLPSLSALDLAANDISLLQPNVFNFTPFLSSLNLSDNPLHCDCSILWFWTWLKEHPLLKEDDRQSVVCTTPPSLENAPLVELNSTDLTCLKDVPDYYHDEADYKELYELRLSDAEVSLQGASWVEDMVQLVWQIDERAVPYTCQAIHIYEVQKVKETLHQILAEILKVNCSSEDQENPHQIVVTVPGTILTPGTVYRYCLVLLEHGTGDEESFLPGCSEALLLREPPSEEETMIEAPEMELTSLIAGNMGMSLVVQTRINNYKTPCSYNVYVVVERRVERTRQLNCSEARHTFPSLPPGEYIICAEPYQETHPEISLTYVEEKLQSAQNTTAALCLMFPACTTVQMQEESRSSWNSGPFLTLLFTLPGLALMITLYLIGRRVWKGGGVPWRWDPRASKRAKYFLYTGETATPTVSLDPLPMPVPESSV